MATSVTDADGNTRTLPTREQLAQRLADDDEERRLRRPRCIDCRGSGGGIIAGPVNGHDPRSCPVGRDYGRVWPDRKHYQHAESALALIEEMA